MVYEANVRLCRTYDSLEPNLKYLFLNKKGTQMMLHESKCGHLLAHFMLQVNGYTIAFFHVSTTRGSSWTGRMVRVAMRALTEGPGAIDLGVVRLDAVGQQRKRTS